MVDFEILIIVFIVSIIQSVFGVGVLLFGTPILLLFGFNFIDVLTILLPISILINMLQIINDYKLINMGIYKKVLFYTIPFIILSLVLITKNFININIFVALFLIFITLKDRFFLFSIILKKFLRYDKLYYICMGIIHGMTNLGGALLVAKVAESSLQQHQKRVTIAIAYMTFALFQIGTLFFFNVNYNLINIIYVLIGVITFYFVNKFIFLTINDLKYNQYFQTFLFFIAITLLLKEI